MRRIKNKINFEIRALESDPNKGIKIRCLITAIYAHGKRSFVVLLIK